MSPPDTRIPVDVDFRGLKERILRRELTFPPQVEKLAAVCFARPELFAFEPAAEIAAQANVPQSTITRFVKRLGKSKLKEAREIFRNELRRTASIDAQP